MTRPYASRRGRTLTTAGPGSSGPVRTFGPARSIRIAAGPAVPFLGAPQVLDHRAPTARAPSCAQLMRMQSMPWRQELRDQRVVVGGLARHRHHDGHAAPGRARAEHRFGVRVEQPLTGGVIDVGSGVRGRPVSARASAAQDGEDGVDRGQHVRLGPAERRQTRRSAKLCLQRAQVAAAQGQVVQQIPRAEPGAAGCDVLQQVGRIVDQAQHVAPHPVDILNQLGHFGGCGLLVHGPDIRPQAGNGDATPARSRAVDERISRRTAGWRSSSPAPASISVSASRPRRDVPFWWKTKSAHAVASLPVRDTTTWSSVSDMSVDCAKPRACASKN